MLPDGSCVALDRDVTIGRAEGNDVRLADPSVSRQHARVVAAARGPVIEDAGSSHGTWVDGRRSAAAATLRTGMRVRLGDVELRVERRRPHGAPPRTLAVEVGASRMMGAAGDAAQPSPRVRSGWTLKECEDGSFVLRSARGDGLLALEPAEAQLLALMDGTRSVAQLVAQSERLLGVLGPARLAQLVAALGEHGLLDGVPGAAPARRRQLVWRGAGAAVDALYRRGAFLLFTIPGLALLALVAVTGIAAFVLTVVRGEVTPFVVAGELALGVPVFIAGRIILVGAHELAHGLAAASFGRRLARAGLRLVAGVPVAFVDTSEAWLEPRRRRLAITAAGPAADLVLGGACSIGALVAPPGALRDVLFQLALGCHLAQLANLNPLLDRDGRALLSDLRPVSRSR